MAKAKKNAASTKGGEGVVFDLVNTMVEAAKDTALIETGRLAFQKWAQNSNPKNPELLLSSIGNPLAQLGLSAGVSAVAAITGQQSKETDFAAKAMAAYGYHNLLHGFEVGTFIKGLNSGALALEPGDEGVPFTPNTKGKQDAAQTKGSEDADFSEADIERGPMKSSVSILEAAIKARDAEAEKKDLRVCPRCIAQHTSKPVDEAIKLITDMELHRPNKMKKYEPKYRGVLEKAEKWASASICGSCRDLLNREVQTAYKAIEGQLKKQEELDALEALLSKLRNELQSKFEAVNACLKKGIKYDDYYKDPDNDDLYENPIISKAGAISLHSDLTTWQADIKTTSERLAELKAELGQEGEAPDVDNAAAKESVTQKEEKAEPKTPGKTNAASTKGGKAKAKKNKASKKGKKGRK